MGNSASRIDKFYGNYEKSFERVEKDVLRVKVQKGVGCVLSRVACTLNIPADGHLHCLQAQIAARGARKAGVTMWTSALVVMALAVAVAVVYQVGFLVVTRGLQSNAVHAVYGHTFCLNASCACLDGQVGWHL